MNCFIFHLVLPYGRTDRCPGKGAGRREARRSHVSDGTKWNTETWLSGRKHLAANEAGEKSSRGFKSHRLRKNNEQDAKRLARYFCGEILDFARTHFARAERVVA